MEIDDVICERQEEAAKKHNQIMHTIYVNPLYIFSKYQSKYQIPQKACWALRVKATHALLQTYTLYALF